MPYTHINGILHHHRPLTLEAAGASTITPELPEGPCSSVAVDQDDYVIYGQPTERPLIVPNGDFADGALNWTVGSGWAITAGTGAAHSSGTAALSFDTTKPRAPLVAPILGEPMALLYTIAGRTAGQVTPSLGSDTLTARTANGTFLEVGTWATDLVLDFVPDTDFDGTISDVWLFPMSRTIKAGQDMPEGFSHIVGAAAYSAPATLIATPQVGTLVVWAGWYRGPLFKRGGFRRNAV
jgi:hypothetical protein